MWTFWLSFAALASYDVWGLNYDLHHNRGIALVLFASVCTMIGDFETRILSEHATVDEFIALSRATAVGLTWGIAFFRLFSAAETMAACLWLITAPLFVTFVGLPILAKFFPGEGPTRATRVAAGLSCIGILTGHHLSKSSLGRMIDEQVSRFLAPLGTFSTFTAMASTAIMFLSEARILQDRLQAAKDCQLSKGMPAASVNVTSLTLLGRAQGLWSVATWTIGLALCVGTMHDPHARATLVSGSATIVLTMTFVPLFPGKTWYRYRVNYIQLLFALHVAAATLFCLRHIWVARSNSVVFWDSD